MVSRDNFERRQNLWSLARSNLRTHYKKPVRDGRFPQANAFTMYADARDRILIFGYPQLRAFHHSAFQMKLIPGVASLPVDQWLKECPAFESPKPPLEPFGVKRRASLVINLAVSQRGSLASSSIPRKKASAAGSFDLRRGHVVELILDEDPLRPERAV